MIKHYFAVVDVNCDEVKINTPKMLSIEVPDELMRYLADSLKWINSLWNGKSLRPSVNYYGYSYLEGEDLERLKELLHRWANLFCLATTEKICLTVGYVYTHEEMKPELYRIGKTELISILVSLCDLCDKAVRNGMKLLYIGI